jgi:hypothetical protein
LPTQSLRDAARAAAVPTLDEPEGDLVHEERAKPATVRRGSDKNAVEPLEDIEYTGPIAEVPQVPVHVAYARVMADVQSVGKADRRDDVGGRYNFRGVDRVVNAVGPALRRHGVVVIPVRVFDVDYKETKTSGGKVMQECTLKVEWAVIGPMGDELPVSLQSAGQANDTSDKATAKAMSVAQRVLFLTGLHIPTQDPTIDQGHDRGEQPRPDPNAYRDEAVDPATSLGRLRQMRTEVARHGLAGALVINGEGDEEQLLALIDRTGKERQGGGS